MRIVSRWLTPAARRCMELPGSHRRPSRDPLEELEYRLTRSPLPVRISMPYAGIPDNKGPLENAPGGSIVLAGLSAVLLVCLIVLIVASL